jgi:hypothetical protein
MLLTVCTEFRRTSFLQVTVDISLVIRAVKLIRRIPYRIIRRGPLEQMMPFGDG